MEPTLICIFSMIILSYQDRLSCYQEATSWDRDWQLRHIYRRKHSKAGQDIYRKGWKNLPTMLAWNTDALKNMDNDIFTINITSQNEEFLTRRKNFSIGKKLPDKITHLCDICLLKITLSRARYLVQHGSFTKYKTLTHPIQKFNKPISSFNLV